MCPALPASVGLVDSDDVLDTVPLPGVTHSYRYQGHRGEERRGETVYVGSTNNNDWTALYPKLINSKKYCNHHMVKCDS